MTVDRSGWGRGRYFSTYYKNERCSACFHAWAAHFWWTRLSGPGEIEKGCNDCPDNTCKLRVEEQKLSAVNLCERCGALMLGKAVASIDYMTGPRAANEHIELCPGCVGAFMDFLHSATTPMQATPYREEWQPAPEQTESRLMLEHGYCGKSNEELGTLCLRPKGHEGMHKDGEVTWQ